ncbi:hypothetical protein DXG03_008902 [Asterophora parasitica]|uniref:Uncharacterized protein n=1 Tax=Asterophora parasitica TaxID=117018 RepID=A0A9P7KFI9_9AGAR|nr:hypothetical protein DXG03_008902 [Asterophora parasitica]
MERQPPPTDLPKRMSVALPNGPTMFPSSGSSPKKEKRGSVLGRLVKKFSILKKHASGREDEWHQVASDQPMVDNAPAPRSDYFLPERQPSPEKLPSDSVKRVPPPSTDESPPVTPDEPIKRPERSSFISLEAPFSIGRLTVANPDAPGSGETTPVHRDIPLPPEKFELTNGRVNADMYRSHSPSSPLRPAESISPDLPDILSPPPPPPAKERIPEMLPMSSPSSLTPSFDQQRRSFAPKHSSPSVRAAPSVVSRTSRISVKDTQSPGSYAADKATISSYRTGSSFNTTQPAEPVSRVFETPGPPPPQKMRPASVASSVPFPAAEAEERVQSWHVYDNSPLSAASMIANPPTPYSNDTPALATPLEQPPPALSRSATDNVSAFQLTRQTETFRLVRSPSGSVYASNETFVAGGQQWEVVEATDKGKSKASSSSKDRSSRDRDSKEQDTRDSRQPKDRDSKHRSSKDRESKERERDFKDRESKDRERDSKDRDSSRREKKRESRTIVKAEPEPEAESSRPRHRSHREKAGATSASKPTMRTEDSDHRHRESSSTTVGERDHDARRREDRERRRSERKKKEAAVNAQKAQPSPSAPPPDAPYSRPLGRHPSLSARPTSQLPSADEMNAIKAKEAWEMERLWKARSMQGEELSRYQTIPSNHNTPMMGSTSDADSQSALYGSSHTAFVVSTPFQGQHSIYHSMPSAAPPIIYSSASSIPTVVHQLPPTNRKSHPRLYADSIASDVASYTSSNRTPNTPARPPDPPNPPVRSADPPVRKLIPLPDPPRESSYEIPADTRNSEYWTKYAGLTTSH